MKKILGVEIYSLAEQLGVVKEDENEYNEQIQYSEYNPDIIKMINEIKKSNDDILD